MHSSLCLCLCLCVCMSTYKMYRQCIYYIQSFNFSVIFEYQTGLSDKKKPEEMWCFCNQHLLLFFNPSTRLPFFLLLCVSYLLLCRHSYHTIDYPQFYFTWIAAIAIIFTLSLLCASFFFHCHQFFSNSKTILFARFVNVFFSFFLRCFRHSFIEEYKLSM